MKGRGLLLLEKAMEATSKEAGSTAQQRKIKICAENEANASPSSLVVSPVTSSAITVSPIAASAIETPAHRHQALAARTVHLIMNPIDQAHLQQIPKLFPLNLLQQTPSQEENEYETLLPGNQRLLKHCAIQATLSVCDRYIKTALSKKRDDGFIDADARGKHGNQRKIDSEVKDSVFNFINSIPRIESHYLRAQTTREYISCEKCLADLYRDYKNLREQNNVPPASASTFSRIFNEEFNISFYVPKKDQCDLCESYKNADGEDKARLSENYENHLKEKGLARLEKEADKNNKNVVLAVYDLQAVMQVPKGQVSLFFYKSRINCLNLTVSDLNAKDVVCFFWDETEAKRGANEIATIAVGNKKTNTYYLSMLTQLTIC
ncbi:unnamed protein product [Pieris macdunnoughi]|uniref:Uncharacterized protein n=1 Tax=Pieris macdunnoughi TaxID=345717 RepID=A0A821LWG8_9NEOP|nr:unnamed protein product [Pieris macdunnoughi]